MGCTKGDIMQHERFRGYVAPAALALAASLFVVGCKDEQPKSSDTAQSAQPSATAQTKSPAKTSKPPMSPPEASKAIADGTECSVSMVGSTHKVGEVMFVGVRVSLSPSKESATAREQYRSNLAVKWGKPVIRSTVAPNIETRTRTTTDVSTSASQELGLTIEVPIKGLPSGTELIITAEQTASDNGVSHTGADQCGTLVGPNASGGWDLQTS